MTQRNIELQIALPKLTEAAQLQSQLSRQHFHQHGMVAQVAQAEVRHRMSRPDRPDEKRAVSEDGARSRAFQNRPGERRQRADSPQPEAAHPFKGKYVDLIG